MKSLVTFLGYLAVSSIFVSIVVVASSAKANEHSAGVDNDALRLNQVQVIGSHNSFKAAIDPALFEMMSLVKTEVRELDYAHPPLTDQLNLGLRSLELDLFHDPDGGHYAEPLGIKMLKSAGAARAYDPDRKMLQPGFKVLHVQDIDFRSNCLTLVDALREIRRWSDTNPRHLPVLITFNLTDATIELPGAVKPIPFDREALDALDEVFLAELGEEKLLRPDQVRGEHRTLEAAVRQSGWPTLAAARGRFLLVLDDFGHKKNAYLEGYPGLQGRVMFVNSSPGHPEAAVMIRNNPLDQSETINQLVRQGYLVRTRADAGTLEARAGDFSRFEAAKKSGAQIISTDYYQADWRLNPEYRIRFDDGSCERVNPVAGK